MIIENNQSPTAVTVEGFISPLKVKGEKVLHKRPRVQLHFGNHVEVVSKNFQLYPDHNIYRTSIYLHFTA